LSKESIMPSINAINPLSFQPMVSEWEEEQLLQSQHHKLVSKKEPQSIVPTSKKKPPKVGDIRYVKPSRTYSFETFDGVKAKAGTGGPPCAMSIIDLKDEGCGDSYSGLSLEVLIQANNASDITLINKTIDNINYIGVKINPVGTWETDALITSLESVIKELRRLQGES